MAAYQAVERLTWFEMHGSGAHGDGADETWPDRIFAARSQRAPPGLGDRLRIAVSGSHSVGKTTLIDSFLDRHPEYAHESEAFEVLADDIDLTESGAPTSDGLRSLLEYTVSAVHGRAEQACVMFERSPVDYLAYAAACARAWPPGEVRRFLIAQTPIVRTSIEQLDLVAYLPLSTAGPVRRRGEEKRFRRRVDRYLRSALLDDAYGLFVDGRPPRVVALPSTPEKQLDMLSRLAQTKDG